MIKYFKLDTTSVDVLRFATMVKPVIFLQETYAELKKVVWPTRSDVIRLTAIVLFLSVVMGLYIGGLDYIFTKAMEFILR